MLLDGHIHLRKWFDENGTDFFEGLDHLIAERKLEGINLAALPNEPRGDVSANIMAALYKLHNPKAYAHAGLVFEALPIRPPVREGMDPLTQYRELMEIGFDGIKLICSKPQDYKLYDFPISDDFFDPFFAAAEKDGTHILWHVADPETFWDLERIPERFLERGWYYGDGSYPSNKQIYDDVFAVMKKHPLLNVTFAHFFFLSDHPDALEKMFADYKNLTIDITPGTEMYESFGAKPDFYKAFFEKHSDRILFGTDTSFPGNGKNLHDSVYRAIATTDKAIPINVGEFDGLGVSGDAVKRIFSGNFKSRVSETPKAINVPALKAYIQKYRFHLKDEVFREKVLECEKQL